MASVAPFYEANMLVIATAKVSFATKGATGNRGSKSNELGHTIAPATGC